MICAHCISRPEGRVRQDLIRKLKTHTQVAGSGEVGGPRRGGEGRWLRGGWKEGKQEATAAVESGAWGRDRDGGEWGGGICKVSACEGFPYRTACTG